MYAAGFGVNKTGEAVYLDFQSAIERYGKEQCLINGLDEKNWVVDFGGLKELKEWLKYMFDHTYLVATDDPEFETFVDLSNKNIIDMREVSSTGCERFAELTFNEASRIIEAQYGKRCWVESVTVREHEHNSATVRRIDA